MSYGSAIFNDDICRYHNPEMNDVGIDATNKAEEGGPTHPTQQPTVLPPLLQPRTEGPKVLLFSSSSSVLCDTSSGTLRQLLPSSSLLFFSGESSLKSGCSCHRRRRTKGTGVSGIERRRRRRRGLNPC